MRAMTPRSRRRASSLPAAAISAPTLVLDDEGREVVKFTTPDGVTAGVAACIPGDALSGLQRSLHRQLKAIRKRQRASRR